MENICLSKNYNFIVSNHCKERTKVERGKIEEMNQFRL
jgi:hypothetical protein